MPNELVIDPVSEDSTNVELSISDESAWFLMAHDFPTPARKSVWGGSISTEGQVPVEHQYENRTIPLGLEAVEGTDPAATNLITNPSFETVTTGWTSTFSGGQFGATGATLTREADADAPSGSYVGKVVTTGVASQGANYDIALTSGTTYAVRIKLKRTAGGNVRISIGDLTSPFNDHVVVGLAANPDYVEYTALITASASTTHRFYLRGVDAVATTFYFDAVLVAVSAAQTGYFDGDTPGCAWTGTPHASTSTRPAPGGLRLEAILRDLQQKVGKINREGGTLKRTSPSGEVIVFDLVEAEANVTFDLKQHIGHVASVDVEFTARPFWRKPAVQLSDHAETTLPHVVFTETGIEGDVPALGTLVVDEDDGDDQLFVMFGVQSRYYDPAASAALFYEAESRTVQGGATAVAGTAPASGTGSNVVRQGTLTGVYQSMLSTQAASAGAHLSHVGSFRVWARVFRPTGNTGAVSLRLEWAEGDFRKRTLNNEVAFAVGELEGVWMLVDLGQVHLTKVAQGTQRWEGRILAKSTVAGDDLDVDCLFVMPVDEGYGEIRAATATDNPTAFSARDEFDQSAGSLIGKTLPVGGTWAEAGDTDDFQMETAGKTATRSAVSDADDVGQYAIAGSTSYTQIAVQVDFTRNTNWNVPTDFMLAPIQGVFARRDPANHALRAFVYLDSAGKTQLRVEVVVSGLGLTIAQVELPYLAAIQWATIRLRVDTSGLWVVYYGLRGGGLSQVAAGYEQVLATGGALATGTVGMYDENRSTQAIVRAYDNFAAWVPPAAAAVFASQSLEVRHDRVIREDSAGTIWSPVSDHRGDYLKIPPAGREGRSGRVIVKASSGPEIRPGVLVDRRIDDSSARLTVTPRGLVTPEPS